MAHDEGAESAFNVLLERHGPMVLAVCRRILSDPHDAEDAFQATFLVLVRKAGSVRKRDSIADWLYGVARRVSAHARTDSARRRLIERRAVSGSWIANQPPQPDIDITDEVEHLPQELRAPVVLCYLQGLTHEQAARRLGWPVGTVRSRLARARLRLRADLTRRGTAPDAALLPMLAFRRISLPEKLIDATVKAAIQLTARDAGEAGLVSAFAVALTEGVLRTMFVSKLKAIALTLIAVGAITSGVGLYAYQGIESGADPAIAVTPPAQVGNRRLTSEELDAYAARVEQLVRRARQKQAAGEWEGADLDVRESEVLARQWEKALIYRRKSETGLPPGSSTPAAETKHPVIESNPPDPAQRRLDELEHKVDRILQALENDGRDHAERPNQKPTGQPENPGKTSAAPNKPRGNREATAAKLLSGDLAKIQGTWKGKAGVDRTLQTVETFSGQTGNAESTTLQGERFGLTFRFDIDENAKPYGRLHIYDIIRYSGGSAGAPDQVHGIYKFIDENTIVICNRFDGVYPTGFTDQPSSVVFTLKRETAVEKTEK